MLKGFTKTCGGKKTAGIMKIMLIPRNDITSVGYDVTDAAAIKTITMGSKSAFVKYEFLEDEAEFQENYKSENGIVSVEQKLTLKLGGMLPESRMAVEELAMASDCGLVAAVVRNGKIQIVGWDAAFEGERPLRLQSTAGTSGKKLSDAAGEEITLGRESTEKAHYYIGEESALTTPAV